MKRSVKTGFGFGLTSSVITTLGLMVGMYSGTHLQLAVIGVILMIAVADSVSDALGIHLSEESKGRCMKSVWESTISTVLSKFLFTLLFIIPCLLFSLQVAIIVNIMFGMVLLAVFSFYIARTQNLEPWKVILEHVGIATCVLTSTYFLGIWISGMFLLGV